MQVFAGQGWPLLVHEHPCGVTAGNYLGPLLLHTLRTDGFHQMLFNLGCTLELLEFTNPFPRPHSTPMNRSESLVVRSGLLDCQKAAQVIPGCVAG